jgi:hypothetical protein
MKQKQKVSHEKSDLLRALAILDDIEGTETDTQKASSAWRYSVMGAGRVVGVSRTLATWRELSRMLIATYRVFYHMF